jgi:hypothetical protein
MFVRILYVIGVFIEFLIGLRFVFLLFGANPTSPVVSWVYHWSSPFVAPFAGIFGQSATITGTGSVVSGVFDWTALIALVVYGLVLGLLSAGAR